MKNSKQLSRLCAVLLLFVFAMGNIQAMQKEEKEKKERKEKRERKDRTSWIRISPVAPVPPVPPVSPIPPVPPISPISPIAPIASVSPIAPIVPIAPVVAVAPVAPVAPISPIAPVSPVVGTTDWYHYDGGGNKGLTIREVNGFYTETKGKVRLDRDKKAIKSISRNGYIKIKDKNTGQEILVEEEEGVLYYNYYNRGRKLPYEDEGKAWFEEIWRDVVRQVGR
jgi:hypothetical protein